MKAAFVILSLTVLTAFAAVAASLDIVSAGKLGEMKERT